MKAMILAAGRGQRMRALTEHTPKPLLQVGGKPLIYWHLERLAAVGFRDIVVNHAYLGEQIVAALGEGQRWGVRISYSAESAGALETAGGITTALPLLQQGVGDNDPFLVVNADIYCDWPYNRALDIASTLQQSATSAYLILVDNPPHNAKGDFALSTGKISGESQPLRNLAADIAVDQCLTFSGIGIYKPDFFDGQTPGVAAKLAPLLRSAAELGQLLGEYYDGKWTDVGTPERLAQLDQELSA